MGSAENSNPREPFDNYRDCSVGVCSRFCPQFCYLIFSSPPTDDDSGATFSPLLIAIICVVASIFVLVSYYTIVARYCKRSNNDNTGVENHNEIIQDQSQAASTGLDEALIETITVCMYGKGNGLIEDTECAVCLSEFQEMESLRLLPKCRHAFHLPCIDAWLKSQSNCPLCRADVIPLAPPLSSSMLNTQTPSALNNMNSYEIQPTNHLVLVVDDQEIGSRQGVVVLVVNDHGDTPKSLVHDDTS